MSTNQIFTLFLDPVRYDANSWSLGHARVPSRLSVEASNSLTARQNKANPSLATRSKRLHTGHQRTLLSHYISGESLLRVQPGMRFCLGPAGGEVWKWSCSFSGSNKKPSACFYHHQHGANKTDELERRRARTQGRPIMWRFSDSLPLAVQQQIRTQLTLKSIGR